MTQVPQHTTETEMKVGNMRLRQNQIAVVILRSPAYEGQIIIPDSADSDTRLLPQTMYVLGKGPGYHKRRHRKSHYFEGTKRWGEVIEDLDQVKPSLHYVGHVDVNNWYLMKHPFVRNLGVWVKDLMKTHPDIHDKIDDKDVRIEGGVLQHRIFVTCSSEVLAKVEFGEGEGIDDLKKIRRGDMMSVA